MRTEDHQAAFDRARARLLDIPGDLGARLIAVGAAAQLELPMTALEYARGLPAGHTRDHLLRSLGVAGFEAPLWGEVRALFDDYAPRFDDHLVHTLGYTGHARLSEALVAHAPRGQAQAHTRLGDVLDLGCGTGLCGPHLRPHCLTLEGVDIAPEMTRRCRDGAYYDHAWTVDLVIALALARDKSKDTLVSADVLGYLGPLDAVFEHAARVTRPEGLFGFTVEALGSDDDPSYGGAGWALGPARRALYDRKYLRDLIGSHWDIETFEQTAMRRESDSPVPAWLVVLRRAG